MSRTPPSSTSTPATLAAARRSKFRPDYAVPPGATLAEWLEENDMTQAELATRLSLSAKALNQIVRGHVPLSQDTALKLETVTGIPARTWNALEALYAEDKARLARDQSLADQVEFLREMPVAVLRQLGHVTRPATDQVGTLIEVLAFFGVADPDAWRKLWQSPQAAFRKSQTFSSQPGAVAAWLRLGELEAAGRSTGPYDKTKLQAALPRLRALTAEPDPTVFQPQLEQLCADAGVVVVFVEEVKGARCSGASRWIDGRPVVQLSLRYGSDDQMWFSLFHELAHVLLHGRGEVFIDASGPSQEHSAQEGQANAFAGALLIPAEYDAELSRLRSLDDMRRFATRLGISPGIVVGRLQRDKLIDYNVGNGLKRRYIVL